MVRGTGVPDVDADVVLTDVQVYRSILDSNSRSEAFLGLRTVDDEVKK